MMKIYDKKLAYPYFVWMTLFTVVPLIIVVYYAFTDANGAFTLDNLTSISGYGSVFARSLLLAAEHMSIAEIAQRVGFSDPAYFARAFRRHTGKSPVAYRALGGA